MPCLYTTRTETNEVKANLVEGTRVTTGGSHVVITTGQSYTLPTESATSTEGSDGAHEGVTDQPYLIRCLARWHGDGDPAKHRSRHSVALFRHRLAVQGDAQPTDLLRHTRQCVCGLCRRAWVDGSLHAQHGATLLLAPAEGRQGHPRHGSSKTQECCSANEQREDLSWQHGRLVQIFSNPLRGQIRERKHTKSKALTCKHGDTCRV